MSDLHIGILLAFTAAMTFVGQNFWLRELQAREGPWRYVFLINAAPAVAGLVSWTFMPPDLSWELVRGAAYASVPGIFGMMSLGLAVHYGDISHVGPIIGGKSLMVIILAASLGMEPTSPELWAASAVLLVALFLISGNREVLVRPWRVAEPAVLLAVGFCVAYGVCDLITRKQMATYHLGVWDFLVMNWLIRAILTGLPLLIICLVRRQRFLPTRLSTFLWTIPALGLHGIAFNGSLKFTNSAVLTNVLVSVRGLLSVVAVLVLAHWGLVRKEPMTRPVIIARLVGSVLICLAVYLGLRSGLPSH
ncbi:MAG: hypothetical protein JXL80_05445 [Planctomycetes bacterium]|nr:hypothetical protein [Planctomycetota bacterium]